MKYDILYSFNQSNKHDAQSSIAVRNGHSTMNEWNASHSGCFTLVQRHYDMQIDVDTDVNGGLSARRNHFLLLQG